MARLLALLWLALVALAAPAAAQTFPEHGGSPVVDQADLLRPEQEIDLKSKAQALHAQTGRAFVVATVKSLEGQTIEDYGNGLLRHWKVGDKERDDGVILLVAPNERKVRIETGYGAEGFLPDILAGRIIRELIVPRFKNGDMPGGVMAGADAIIQQMSLPGDQAQERITRAEQTQKAERSGGFPILPVVFWGLVIGFVLLSMGRRANGRRYVAGAPRSKRGRRRRRGDGFDSGDLAILLWGLSELSRGSRRGGGWGGGFGGGSWGGGGGGFGGGGFGGFGGGSGGGGGASGSW